MDLRKLNREAYICLMAIVFVFVFLITNYRIFLGGVLVCLIFAVLFIWYRERDNSLRLANARYVESMFKRIDSILKGSLTIGNWEMLISVLTQLANELYSRDITDIQNEFYSIKQSIELAKEGVDGSEGILRVKNMVEVLKTKVLLKLALK